jgi:hypothetical protein
LKFAEYNNKKGYYLILVLGNNLVPPSHPHPHVSVAPWESRKGSVDGMYSLEKDGGIQLSKYICGGGELMEPM